MKKNVLISVATITMLCFIFASCAGGSDKKAEEDANKVEKTEEEKSAESTESSTKEITEDIYVEIIAQQMYLTDKYSKKAEDVSDAKAMKLTTEMGEEMSELYDEHGVTQDDFDQFADEIMEDMETYGAIMDRANKRVEELKAEDE
ncbi:MAG: hypothetical protein ACQESZ_02480 [Bacteroidota bacterium]